MNNRVATPRTFAVFAILAAVAMFAAACGSGDAEDTTTEASNTDVSSSEPASTDVATSAPPETPAPFATRSATSVNVGVGVFQGCWTDGLVHCWGENDRGQLGQGSTAELEGTVVVQDLSGVTTVVSGDQHSCALVGRDGEVYCWGMNDYGQLGSGDFADGFMARPVQGLTDVVALVAGDFHNCAIAGPDRQLWCWGMNVNGQLASKPSYDGVNLPIRIPGFSKVIAVDAGFSHTCVITEDTTVSCFGEGLAGETGGALDGEIGVIEGVSDAVQIRIGSNQSCARLLSGDVRCWGGNNDGEYGDLPTGSGSTSSALVSGLSPADQIAVGLKHVCSLRSGRVACFGERYIEPTAPGETVAPVDPGTPIPMPDPKRAVSIDANYNEICAVHADGSVACWDYRSASTTPR